MDLWTIRCVGVILKSRALRLLAALAVLAAGNLFYLSWDAAPPERAPAGHLLALMDGSPSPFAMPAALVARVAGPSPGNCAMANLFWAALLAAAMYRIGRRLHGETAGLLGACLLLVYPAVFGLTREFRPHVAALAMTALGFSLLVESREFRATGRSLLFGAALGVAAVVEPLCLLFLIAPLVHVLVRVAREAVRPGEQRSPALRSLARAGGALLIAGAIATAWHAPALLKSGLSGWPGGAGLSVAAVLRPARAVVVRQIGLPFFALAVYGLLVLPRAVNRRDATTVYAWLAGLYVLLVFFPPGRGWDALGLLVPLASASAVGLGALTKFRRTAVAVVAAFALVQFAALTLPEPMVARPLGGFRWAGDYDFARPPSRDDWSVEEALRAIAAEKDKATVGLLCDHPVINAQTFGCVARRLGLSLRLVDCREQLEDFRENLGSYDLVVDKPGWRPPVGAGAFRWEEARRHFDENRAGFRGIRSFNLPDGSSMILYRNLLPREGGLAGPPTRPRRPAANRTAMIGNPPAYPSPHCERWDPGDVAGAIPHP